MFLVSYPSLCMQNALACLSPITRFCITRAFSWSTQFCRGSHCLWRTHTFRAVDQRRACKANRNDSCSEIKNSSPISAPTNPVFLFLWSAYRNVIPAGAAVVRCDVNTLVDVGTFDCFHTSESLMASRGLPRNVIAVVDTAGSKGSWRASGNE